MKLLEFHARGVFDYLRFDVKFDGELTLLTGGNGSGKTTVIRLIQALLTASIRELNLLPFKSAKLLIESSGKKYTISALYLEDSIDLSITGISEPIHLIKIDPEEVERRSIDMQRNVDFFEEATMKYVSSDVFKFLASLDAPVILGLERRIQSSPIANNRERYFSRATISSRRRIFHGTLGLSLAETQIMVQESYRQIRDYQDTQNETLRENILLSMFDYTESKNFWPKFNQIPNWKEQGKILDRKIEVESSLMDIVADDSKDKVKNVIEEFFKKIDLLMQNSTNKKYSETNLVDWLLNKTQVDRIMSIIEVVDKHKTLMGKFMEPLNLFLQIINGFYSDSKKRIQIDGVGFLNVFRETDNQTTSVEALSSGERQLLIIFAHLMFNRYAKKSSVFIIDEPELSLHLKWQSMFIDQIIMLSPNTQFIMATHSPEIVGEYEQNCFPLPEVQ